MSNEACSLRIGAGTSRIFQVRLVSEMVGTAQERLCPPYSFTPRKKGGQPSRLFLLPGLVRLSVAADHGTYGVVGAKILRAIDIEQRREFRSRAVDAALDGADRAAADRRGVLIGEAGGADQDQGLALVLREFVQRGAEFLELQMCALRRLRFQRLGIVAFGVLHLAPPLAVVGAKQVAQNGEQPRRQIGAGLERVDVGNGAEQRLLHQIVGTIAIAAERNRERAQAWHRRQDVVAKLVGERHYSLPLFLSVSPPP